MTSSVDVVREVPAAAGTQWGRAMTANDIYTVAGNPAVAGTGGSAGDGGPATSADLNNPIGVTADAAGDLYIADTFNNRLQEVPAASGTQWGQSMTAGDMYTVINSPMTQGASGDGGPAGAAGLNWPGPVTFDPGGNLLIPDALDNEIREVFATTGQLFSTSPAGPGITVSQADGAQVTFYPKDGSGNCTAPYVAAGGSGYCTLPQNVNATLTYSSTAGTYTYTPAPGTSYTYSAATGALTSESDTAGDTLTLTADSPAPGAGHCPSSASSCTAITAASGRALVLGYNAGGRVISVTDPLGRRWAYAYNSAGQLTSATDPMSHVTSYTYGAGSTGNPQLASDLLTMTSPNAQPGGPDAGKTTVNVYDSSGRVTSQTDPMGHQTTFSYCASAAAGNCMNPVTGTGLVTVTDPDGNKTVYNYQQGTLAATSTFTGSALTSETDQQPDTTTGTLLDAASTDGDGNTTTDTYNAAGNLTQETAPAATGTATTTSGYATQAAATANLANCATTELASSACQADSPPAPVAPGGTITPPSSAPPLGTTYTLYDTDGNQLYSTTGVYQPGASSAAYSRNTYQLFKNNTVTLNGTAISCTATPPSQTLPCAKVNADGVVTQLTYNTAGDLTSTSTPDGNGSEAATTTYAYDGDGEQTSSTAPDGNLPGANAGNYTTVTAWNGDGQKTSVSQGDGSGHSVTSRVTSYGYDGDGNQATVQDARGHTTTTTFNAGDKAALVTDPDGNAALTCYDGDGNVAQTVPAVGVAAGSLTPSSCPASYPSGYGARLASDATTYTFDGAGRKTQTTTPAPAGQSGSETTSYAYDGNGNLLRTTAPPAVNGGSGQVTVDTYTPASQLASETTGYGTSSAATVSYCYDPDGNKTAVTYGNANASGTAACETSYPWVISSSTNPTQAGYQTTYGYDSIGELVTETTPATAAAVAGGTTTLTFDPAGDELTSTDPNGVTTTWTVTPAGQPATESFSGSSAHAVSFGYDASGNRTAMSDATGNSTYVYDSFGELTSATNGAGQVTAYTYSADAQVTSIAYPLPGTHSWAATTTVNYGYDNADIRTSVTDFNNHQITITPNADGLPASVALGATGDTITTTYDAADGRSSILLENGSGTALQQFNYSDSPAGTILSECDASSCSTPTAAYTYDTNSRVTSMTTSGGTSTYGFDASSDLTALPTGATASYDKAGELTSSTLASNTISYTYNAAGQRLTAVQGSTTVASATWNGAGQLAAYSDPAASMSAATYDGNGLRATATTGSGTQQFDWNTTNRTPQLLMDSSNAYIYGTGIAPDEQVNLATGTVTYLVTDSLGSVRGTVSASGILTGTTSYDAWGNPAGSGLASATPLGYAGGYTDPTGLIYLVKRYYDPSTGQFASVDPLLSTTLAPYAYAQGDPVSINDPRGTGRWVYEYEYYSNFSRWITPPCISCTPNWLLNQIVNFYQDVDPATQVDQVTYQWYRINYMYWYDKSYRGSFQVPNRSGLPWRDNEWTTIQMHIEIEYWMISYHRWDYFRGTASYWRSVFLY